MLERNEIGAINLNKLIEENIITNFRLEGDYGVIRYNNAIYYIKKYKELSVAGLYTELIAEELAKDYCIKTAVIDIGVYNDTYFVISKSIKEKNDKYMTFDKIMVCECNNCILQIWNLLEKKIKNKDVVIKIVNDIVNMFLFDVLIGNDDRHESNYGLIKNLSGYSLAPLFDNEEMLAILSSHNKSYAMDIDRLELCTTTFEQFRRFVEISSNEYINYFKDKLWIIENENLLQVINRVENKIGAKIPEEEKNKFLNKMNENLNVLKEILYFKNKNKVKKLTLN